MQDGEFKEDTVAYFIGWAIFVFTGGTMKQFKDKQQDKMAMANRFPDFLSRVKGYIDVTGPNPIPCPVVLTNKLDGCWEKSQTLLNSDCAQITKIDKADKQFIFNCAYRSTCCADTSHYLRRATLLRPILKRKLNKSSRDEIQIADNVLDAFLKVSQYFHGARSMEAIIQTSESPSARIFTASCIYNNYLDLCVTDDFEEYLNQNN